MYFKTKGDANPNEDPWTLTSDHIIGRVMFKVPFLGTTILFLRTPQGLVVLAILLVAWIVYSYVRGGGSGKE